MQAIKRFRRDEKGATAIEFAVVSFAFFMLMFGIIEYGMIMMTQIAIESATQQVSRTASLGTRPANSNCDRACEVRQLIEKKTRGLVKEDSVKVTSRVVSNQTTSTPPIPDICLKDPDDPYPASCPQNSWQENNGSPGYQQPSDISNSDIGAAGEVVEIRVTYLWRVLFPIFRSHFGDKGVLTISAATVVKNEPF